MPEDVDLPAAGARGETEAAMAARAGERRERTAASEAVVGDGREAVESERTQPMAQQVLEEVPLVGGWLAGRIYGTARNEAPDAAGAVPDTPGGAANGPGGAADGPGGTAESTGRDGN